ncbi:MAG TPA: nucleotidyltransferase domain-containing protein [Bacteroidales bacterium]|nr:nucleotidyltransferase domain-containing protein [Bacteroidales bacterium]
MKELLRIIKEKEPNLLYLVLTGSRAYGIHNNDSDYDYRGVFLNTPIELFGLEIRNSQEYEGDVVLHSLKEICKLALNANPNVLELLFLPSKYILFCHPLFKKLLDNRNFFLSQKVKYSYAGYAYSQLQRSKHKSTHGTLRDKYIAGSINDPYDSKFAGHTIRLLINGKELLTKGTLSPELSGDDLYLVKSIREGKYFESSSHFYSFATKLISEFDKLILETKLPKTPDINNVNRLLIQFHTKYYKGLLT